MTNDLFFSDYPTRCRQYDARGSVADFEGCMAQYAQLAQRAKSEAPGIYDLHYGMAADERLDLFLPSQQKSPLFVFIHGGYWHSQRKEQACSMAASLTRHGVALATLEYTLMPESTLAEIVREVRSAISWLYHHAADYAIDPQRIFVGGSSAGGHLTGMLVADGWQSRYRVPDNVIKGALALSGLYDLRPLCDSNVNEWLRLTPEQALPLSPLFCLPKKELAPKLLLDVGAAETDGFKHQTQAYSAACRERGIDVTLLNDRQNNHFTLVNELANEQSVMFQQLLRMIASR